MFQSDLKNIDFYDTNDVVDVFVYDRLAGVTRLVSVDGAGVNAGMSQSINPALSGDGRMVAFVSAASNLVTPNTDGASVACL